MKAADAADHLSDEELLTIQHEVHAVVSWFIDSKIPQKGHSSVMAFPVQPITGEELLQLVDNNLQRTFLAYSFRGKILSRLFTLISSGLSYSTDVGSVKKSSRNGAARSTAAGYAPFAQGPLRHGGKIKGNI